MEYFETKLDIFESGGRGTIERWKSGVGVDAALKQWIDHLALVTERKAKEFAPKGQTGQLKAKGVIRDKGFSNQTFGDSGIPGEVVTGVPSFRPGEVITRGSGGRFQRSVGGFSPGHIFSGGLTGASYTATVRLNPEVRHAKWVHEGTGIYGPTHAPYRAKVANYMVFESLGKKWRFFSIKGQRPQPFLTEAFQYVNDVYIPARISQLRAEIDAIT